VAKVAISLPLSNSVKPDKKVAHPKRRIHFCQARIVLTAFCGHTERIKSLMIQICVAALRGQGQDTKTV